MQAGVISSDTFAQILREYGAKRKQGVLEIESGSRRYEIHFSSGKICYAECFHAEEKQGDTVHFLLRALQQKTSLSSSASDWEALYEQWMQNREEDSDAAKWQFSFYLKQAVLETLYTLLEYQNGVFQFRHQTQNDPEQVLPGFSVGQLLLDMVAIEAGEFDGFFEDEDAVAICSEYLGTPTEEERVILSILERKPYPFHELKEISCLSVFHFGSALVSLLERGVISKSEQTAEQVARDSELESEMELDQLEDELIVDEELNFIESVYVWNMRLVYDNRIPVVVGLLFFASACLLPLFFWGSVWTVFSEF